MVVDLKHTIRIRAVAFRPEFTAPECNRYLHFCDASCVKVGHFVDVIVHDLHALHIFVNSQLAFHFCIYFHHFNPPLPWRRVLKRKSRLKFSRSDLNWNWSRWSTREKTKEAKNGCRAAELPGTTTILFSDFVGQSTRTRIWSCTCRLSRHNLYPIIFTSFHSISTFLLPWMHLHLRTSSMCMFRSIDARACTCTCTLQHLKIWFSGYNDKDNNNARRARVLCITTSHTRVPFTLAREYTKSAEKETEWGSEMAAEECIVRI